MKKYVTPYNHPLAFAICGWSGSGKTWLLERLIARLSDQGYWVGAFKHDAHQLNLDHPGKNTARLWDAGAMQLMAHDPQQGFLRYRKIGLENLENQIYKIAGEVDFVLIEGHKETELPKLWLEHPEKKETPTLENVIQTLTWGDEARLQKSEQFIMNWLHEQWQQVPLKLGYLNGGQSSRMGTPKQLLPWQGKSLLEHLVTIGKNFDENPIILGNNNIPDSLSNSTMLPDIHNVHGPLAGILSAMRWNPDTSWLFMACDMPLMHQEAIAWLIDQREPGTWALVPKTGDQHHPLGALYEPQMKNVFETLLRSNQLKLQTILQHPKVKMIEVPTQYQQAWTNCNTKKDWDLILNSHPSSAK